MEDLQKGAWLIHHADKLQRVTNANNFQKVHVAGKCGILLSALSESHNESVLSKEKVEIIAHSSDINLMFELPLLITTLEKNKLIDQDKNGNIAVLGVTSQSLLSHATNIFKDQNPSPQELASLELSEKVSELPKERKSISEYIGDSYKLTDNEVESFLEDSENIGFIDVEKHEHEEPIYFNGNLFRNNDVQKMNKVLSSLSDSEQRSFSEFNETLNTNGCIPYQFALNIMGEKLFNKLNSIGLIDVNSLSNPNETAHYITKPSSFCKYGNPFTEDSLNLAKAFVTALSYGMNQSNPSRGRITMLPALLKKLINGQWVGPADAIAEDYKMLEYKRVVELKASKSKKGKFLMRLLKREIGEIALHVLDKGQASEEMLLSGTSSVTRYYNPEFNREKTRKKQSIQSKRDTLNTLRVLRLS